MKYLIAGLGNPGIEYQYTRHNIGFRIIDALVESYAGASSVFTPERYADKVEFKYKGRIFILIKPTTFMNLSGKAINYWLQKEKIPLERLLVITDDLALPFGKIRLRKKGSAGGHNGLQNIIDILGTTEFPRLRFGIGNEFHKGSQVNYVLNEWEEEEKKMLPERTEIAKEAVISFATVGIERTMSDFNKR